MIKHQHDFQGFLRRCRCGATEPPAETAVISHEFRAQEDPALAPLKLRCTCGSTTFELRGDQRGTAVCSCCHAIARISWRSKWSHEE
jgi:hypothetical protein